MTVFFYSRLGNYKPSTFLTRYLPRRNNILTHSPPQSSKRVSEKVLDKPNCSRQGLTLIETLIGVALFLTISSGIFGTYTNLTRVNKMSQLKVAMTAVGNEYLEIARNLTYSDIGVAGGIPGGILPPNQTVTKGNNSFNVHYSVRNIDDPFDGTIGGTPHDTSPADYKQVTAEVSCLSCGSITVPPLNFSTFLAPKNLETSTNNGALFIQVINANGQAVSGASVYITNSTTTPPININETTNTAGMLQLVDVPPAVESYRVVVTKSGYSTDRTYPPDDPIVVNPIKLDATVVVQQVTQITFAIDRVSQLNAASISATCSPVANVDFNLQGSKLISLNPDVYKYNQNLSTDSQGLLVLNNLEWDSYQVSLIGSTYESRGFIPTLPVNLAPDSIQDLKIVLQQSSPHSLLVIVKDSTTGLPLSGAAVHLSKSGYDQTILTERGYLHQTNWKDGPGQANFSDEEMYWSDDGNIDNNKPVGEIKLKKSGNTYAPAGYLISSSFDTGASTNFTSLEWQPGDQPPSAGTTPVKFQIATNNDNATWNFVGPDGTNNSYYTSSGQTISAVHNGDRYLRYKLFLSTADTSMTPNISDINVIYISTCTPPGQAFFTSLTSAQYTLEVSLAGYQTSTSTVDLSPNWTKVEVNLLPL